MLPDLASSIPWTEILAGISAAITMLLSIGNRKLKAILAQTQNNGGSTIKDQIDRIENSVLSLTLWIEAAQHLTTKPYFKTDAKGNFIWANTAFSRVLGMGIDDLKDSGWLDAIPPDEHDRVKSSWFNDISANRKFNLTFNVKNFYTNEIKKIDARAFPIVINNDVIGYLGTISEVSEPDEE